MTDTLDGTRELDRLLDGAKLARPNPRRDRRGRWQRDPGGQWDWFYELDPSERDYIARRYMGGTVGPDELATSMGADIDSAMTILVDMIRLERSRLDLLDPDYADAWEDASLQPMALVRENAYGLAEIAEHLGAKVSTVYKWQARGILPAADFAVSGAPAWWESTVDEWAKETGRLLHGC